MKRSFPTNINNRIYHIDEDAFQLMNTYLDSLKKAFPDADGQEIANDIECRIGEHFQDRKSGDSSIIDIASVKEVIEIIGSVDELAGFQDNQPESNDNNTAGSPLSTPATVDESEPQNIETVPPYSPVNYSYRKLYRNPAGRIMGGVVGGLSVKYGWNPDYARLICLVSLIFPGATLAFITYIILWLCIPEAKTPQDVLKMYGSPVTLDNLGKAVLSTPPPYTGDNNLSTKGLHKFFRIMCRIFMIVILCVSATVGVVSSVFAVGTLISTTAITFADMFNFSDFSSGDHVDVISICALSFGYLILSVIGFWMSLYVIRNVRTPSKKTVCIALSISLILLVVGAVLGHSDIFPRLFPFPLIFCMLPTAIV